MKKLLLFLLLASPAFGQALNNGLKASPSNPATSLFLPITSGDLTSVLGTYQFSSTTLALVANTTNYIYIDLSQSPPAFVVNQTGFPAVQYYPIATAVTNTNGIVALTDSRPTYNQSSFGVTPGGPAFATQVANSGVNGLQGIAPGKQGWTYTSNGTASPPAMIAPGITGSIDSPVSSTPYTIACDNGTTIVDRGRSLHFNSGSGTITVPLSTASGCTGGLTTILYDDTGTLTVNATSADTFNIYTAGTLLTGQTTFQFYKGQVAVLDQDTTAVWSIRIYGPFNTIATSTNCAANGTAANPSVVSCSAAAAGMFSCATNASTGTCQVNTSAVTANSEIFITQDAADGGASQLNVTCNTTNVLNTSKPLLVSKSAGTSFTINLGTVSSNPACFEFHIVN